MTGPIVAARHFDDRQLRAGAVVGIRACPATQQDPERAEILRTYQLERASARDCGSGTAGEAQHLTPAAAACHPRGSPG